MIQFINQNQIFKFILFVLLVVIIAILAFYNGENLGRFIYIATH